MPNNLVYDVFFGALPTRTFASPSATPGSAPGPPLTLLLAVLFNALLATLNARHELREIVNGSADLVEIPLSAATPVSQSSAATTRSDLRGDVEVRSAVRRGVWAHVALQMQGVPIRVKIDRMEQTF